MRQRHPSTDALMAIKPELTRGPLRNFVFVVGIAVGVLDTIGEAIIVDGAAVGRFDMMGTMGVAEHRALPAPNTARFDMN